jgi:hypothetical protein
MGLGAAVVMARDANVPKFCLHSPTGESAMQRTARHALAASLLLTFAAPSIEALPVDWGEAFQLEASNGIVDPAVLVGFNPQPDPPGTSARLDLRDPTAPLLVIAGQANPQLFHFYLAMSCDGSVKCALTLPALPTTDFDQYAFTASSAAGELTVLLEFATSSLGIIDGTSVVGFNPQPDPPGDFGAGVMGLEFAYTSLSDAMVTLRIFDETGTPLGFAIAAVPEPAALSLFCLGLVGLSARATTRRGS